MRVEIKEITVSTTFVYQRDHHTLENWTGWIEPANGASAATRQCGAVLDETPRTRWWRSRNSAKPMTIRSWRDPRSVGGTYRKGAVVKLLRRLREKTLTPVSGPHGMYLQG